MKEYYSYEDLKPFDRSIYDMLERFSDEVLNQKKISEYLETSIVGNTAKAIFSDVLNPFLEYLKEQGEYFKVDMIIDCVDGYDDKEGESEK